jgi:hypothetical protein
MENQATVFDQCRTSDEIRGQLQRLAKVLLAAVQKHRDDFSPEVSFEKDILELSVLSELSYADLKYHEHPVFLLSEICRLLFK